MNEQEILLELAAKAIRMETSLLPSESDPNRPHKRPWQIEDSEWNPLTNDGDAFRLAIELGIEIHPDNEIAEVHTAYVAGWLGYNKFEEYGDDKFAATRRVIVRSAAHIGELMP